MRRPGTADQSGMTVVELLVTGAILVVVLGIVGIFFGQQVQLQRNVQSRNELQDRVRVAMQLVIQDLALAGNSVVLTSDGGKNDLASWPFCFDGARGCLEIVDGGADASTVRVRYLSSQFPPADACRDITYQLSDGVLRRSDVKCEEASAFIDLAPNMLMFKAHLVCSDGNTYEEFPISACGSGNSYGRSVIVEMEGQSRDTGSHGSEVSAGCSTDHICFALKQEVLVPNMKDQ